MSETKAIKVRLKTLDEICQICGGATREYDGKMRPKEFNGGWCEEMRENLGKTFYVVEGSLVNTTGWVMLYQNATLTQGAPGGLVYDKRALEVLSVSATPNKREMPSHCKFAAKSEEHQAAFLKFIGKNTPLSSLRAIEVKDGKYFDAWTHPLSEGASWWTYTLSSTDGGNLPDISDWPEYSLEALTGGDVKEKDSSLPKEFVILNITSKEQSEFIQRALFAKGYRWGSGREIIINFIDTYPDAGLIVQDSILSYGSTKHFKEKYPHIKDLTSHSYFKWTPTLPTNFLIEILNEKHDKQVQAKLFSLGYTWSGGQKTHYDWAGPSYLNTYPHMFCVENKSFCHSNSTYFKETKADKYSSYPDESNNPLFKYVQQENGVTTSTTPFLGVRKGELQCVVSKTNTEKSFLTPAEWRNVEKAGDWAGVESVGDSDLLGQKANVLIFDEGQSAYEDTFVAGFKIKKNEKEGLTQNKITDNNNPILAKALLMKANAESTLKKLGYQRKS